MKIYRSLSCALSTLLLCFTSIASADVVFEEYDFDPSSFNTDLIHFINPVVPGSSYNITTTQYESQITGKTARQHFEFNPNSEIPIPIVQPIYINSFTFDPQTQGSIQGITASFKTFGISGPNNGGLYWSRIFVKQDGRLFGSTLSLRQLSNPNAFHEESNIQESDFFEILLNDYDLDSHPDFSGSFMEFGVGISLQIHNLQQNVTTEYNFGIDNAVMRIKTRAVPEPASLSLLALGSLAILRRKH
ncbi:PEP-CTERM sorting domain-containing protein [Poriferisphaera sp. WC338]|uniref:PEP-CTERM sorting domain-containing protein n=1 Tax=Poriferisphaera sp. WC338 TaxID=3425129 RepID=UPI003D81A9A1